MTGIAERAAVASGSGSGSGQRRKRGKVRGKNRKPTTAARGEGASTRGVRQGVKRGNNVHRRGKR